MQPPCGMILIFLLVRLQWNKSNTEGKIAGEKNNESVEDHNQSTVQPTSQRLVLSVTTSTNPFTLSHAAPSAKAKEIVTKRTKMSSWPNSIAPRSTDGTTLPSNVTTVSKDGVNNSATNFNAIPTSLEMFTTMLDLSAMNKSAAAIPTSTVTSNNSAVTYSTTLAEARPSTNASINLTVLFPTSITPTSTTVKQDSPTTNFNPIQQTEQKHHFSNLSTAPSNSQDPNEYKTNRRGVIVGAIVGAILGSILIGLIGYFICIKKRSESFSHRRLYDDTRNDPVLHLDSSLGPYHMSSGCVSDDKTSTADNAEKDNTECPSDGIPMADMSLSHSSP